MLDAIRNRRSIRKYTAEPVTEEQLNGLLEAAMFAPSAGNQRPWHFVVIRNRETLTALTTVHPHAKMLLEAPAAILVCGDPQLEMHPGYFIQDCSAAVENILIEAASRGLGTCWLGVHPREDRVEGIRKLLGVPDGVLPFALIAVGHPGESKNTPVRFDAGRIHQEKW